ncbi:M50 family metallopeptidase [Hyphobacterium sp.]|uniref:M50 family metallopeptidase n=1 Tax=Hyphobacterium sp. TaxID=2004662 RepID=UPI003B52B788
MLDLLTSGLVTILAFTAVISVVVIIHELGHYIAGRWCGVHAEVFSMGFGPTLFAVRDKRGTLWRLAALPLGGYVRFMGDAGAASEPDQEKLDEIQARLGADADRCFHFKPLWQRAIIVAAGPIANFVLAVLVFFALFATFGQSTQAPIVGSVRAESEAERAGLQVGDRIVRIAETQIEAFPEIMTEFMLRPDEDVAIRIDRDGRMIDMTVTPRVTRVPDGLGGYRERAIVGFGPTGETYFRRLGPIESVGAAFAQVGRVVSLTGRYVWRIVTGRVPPNMLNGPLGIVTVSGQVANASIDNAQSAGQAAGGLAINLIQLVALFSIGLGLVNLLPIPILDGGHLVYYAYEAVAGRPLSAKAQAIGFRVGLALVLGLMLVATWNDLVYLGGLGS